MESFDKYFAATEDAFTGEHEEFANRIDEIRSRWEEM